LCLCDHVVWFHKYRCPCIQWLRLAISEGPKSRCLPPFPTRKWKHISFRNMAFMFADSGHNPQTLQSCHLSLTLRTLDTQHFTTVKQFQGMEQVESCRYHVWSSSSTIQIGSIIHNQLYSQYLYFIHIFWYLCPLKEIRFKVEFWCMALQWNPDYHKSHVRFEDFMAVTIKDAVFWDITPCGSCNNRHISSQRA
jgi:hypothetical protein